MEKHSPPGKELGGSTAQRAQGAQGAVALRQQPAAGSLCKMAARTLRTSRLPLLRGTFLSKHHGGSVSARAAPFSGPRSPVYRGQRARRGKERQVSAFLMRNSHRPRGVCTAHRPRLDGRKEAGGGEFRDRGPPHSPGRRSVPRQHDKSSPPCPSPARPGGDERSRHYTQALPARPPPDEPRLTLPGAGEQHGQRAMPKRGAGGRGHEAFRAIFTFVGLGDLRHFVQRQRRRGGTGAAPPLPPHGAARARSAQARPSSRGPGARPRPPPDGRRAQPMAVREAAEARAEPGPP